MQHQKPISQRRPTTQPKPLPSTSTSTFSHTIAATTLKPSHNNSQCKTINNHHPHQKPTFQPTSKGQKQAPKTHDKAIGKGKEWIGKSGGGLLGIWAFFEGVYGIQNPTAMITEAGYEKRLSNFYYVLERY